MQRLSGTTPYASVAKLATLAQEGDCSVRRKQNLFCDPLCATATICSDVVSSAPVDVALPGIVSCDSANPCQPPQVRQGNLLCA